jgi:hypothetical protein
MTLNNFAGSTSTREGTLPVPKQPYSLLADNSPVAQSSSLKLDSAIDLTRRSITSKSRNLCLTVDVLDNKALQLLIRGAVSAIRVPSFYERENCDVLANWLLHHPDRALYGQNVSDPSAPDGVRYLDYHVDRIGFPRNLLIGKDSSSPEFNHYFQKRDAIIEGIRTATHYCHPIDRLLVIFNTIWPQGAMLEQIDGQSVFAGIGRITRPGSETLLSRLPHVDGTWPYYLHFSANVYLAIPPEGGELEVFGGPTLSAAEVAALGSDHDFRSDRRYSTSQLIQPQVGDLILINTRRPHAVRTFTEGTRISLATFMGFDPEQPFKFYS